MSQTGEKKRTLLKRSKRLRVDNRTPQHLKRRNLRTNYTPRKASTRRKASSPQIKSRTKVIKWSCKESKIQHRNNSAIIQTPQPTATRTLLKLIDKTNQTSYLSKDLPTRTQRVMTVRGNNSTNSSNIETVLKNIRKKARIFRSRRTPTPNLMVNASSQAMASSTSRMRASPTMTISSSTINHHWFRLLPTSSTRRVTTHPATISILSLRASSPISTNLSPLFSRPTQPLLTQTPLVSNPNPSTLRGSETTSDWTRSFRSKVKFKLMRFNKRD